MNRHAFIIGFLLLSLAIFAGACVHKPQDTLYTPDKPSTPTTVAEKTILLSSDEYIPYEFMQNGILKGIATDTVNAVFKQLGFHTDIKTSPWVRTVELAKNGEVDGIFSAFHSTEREEYLIYTKEPIAYATQTFYILKGNNFKYDGTIESLTPYRIGILRAFSYGDEFDQAVTEGTLNVSIGEDFVSNIDKLVSGRIDVFIENKYAAEYYIKSKNLQDQVVPYKKNLIELRPLYLCFSKRRNLDPELIQDFDVVLKQMKADGSYQKIVDEYIK